MGIHYTAYLNFFNLASTKFIRRVNKFSAFLAKLIEYQTCHNIDNSCIEITNLIFCSLIMYGKILFSIISNNHLNNKNIEIAVIDMDL